MLPEHLIDEFWDTVASELRKKFDLSKDNTATAIMRYQAAMERHHVGDILYHRDPEYVAETIAAGWEKGFPLPEPVRAE